MTSSVSANTGKKKSIKKNNPASSPKKLSISSSKRNGSKGSFSSVAKPTKRIAFEGDSVGNSHGAVNDNESIRKLEKKGKKRSEKEGLIKIPASSIRSSKKRLQKERRSDSDEDETESHATFMKDLMADEKDDLQDVLMSSSEDDGEDSDGEKNGFEKFREGMKLSYPAIRFRFLPPEFEEPQLFKFLNQFGATVLNCFCVRSKRTFQSLGIAYAHFSDSAVLPIVKEECDGMFLGSRTVRARIITLHRPMPSKEAVTKRRLLGRAYRDKGAPLHQYVRSYKKNEIAALIKATRSEVRNNHLLKAMGIDFRSTAFADQLEVVPKSLLLGKKRPMVTSLLKLAKENGCVPAAPTHTSPTTKKGETDDSLSSSRSTEQRKATLAVIHRALGRPTERRKHRGRSQKKGESAKNIKRTTVAKHVTTKATKAKRTASKKSEVKELKETKKKKVRRSLKKKTISTEVEKIKK